MKKILTLGLAVLLLSACATVKNVSEETSDVSFNFSNSGTTVLTFWKKLNDDGSVKGPFAVGISQAKLLMNAPFPKASVTTIKLDPGYYFLDSFQVNMESRFFVSQKGNYTSRNGWDKNANAPKFLAFTLNPGETLILPSVEVIPNTDENSGKTAVLKYDDPKGIFVLGTLVEKN